MTEAQKIDLSYPSRPRVAEAVRNLEPSGIREFFELVIGRDDIISLGVGDALLRPGLFEDRRGMFVSRTSGTNF